MPSSTSVTGTHALLPASSLKEPSAHDWHTLSDVCVDGAVSCSPGLQSRDTGRHTWGAV